ncbi:MAG: MBL fold metallo-hydrolase [Caulobacteraceae bacterium]|nr:MBL fold metallo-hydrolase [Caulobacteraceae bacterium]
MTRCRVRILRAGACRHPAFMARRGAGLNPVVFPSLVGLIEHPLEGPILFDTGYDPAFLRATEPFPERFYRWATPVELDPREPASAQVRRLGHAPEDITAVVISHFHGDHVAGLHAFPRARLFCARAGLAQVRGGDRLGRVRRGVLAGLAPADVEARARYFEDLSRTTLPPALAPFDSGADLFGDGSLVAVELPGHCPGHWGLAVRREDDALEFFVADAAWSTAAVREAAPPPAFTTAVLGETAPYRETFARLHQLWAANPDLTLTPSHCPEAAARAEPLDDA